MLFETIIEALEVLDEIKRRPLEEVMASKVLTGCMLWNLYTAVQSTIDLTLKAIVKLRLPTPETYAEAFQILSRHKVIPEKLRDEMIEMVRFRHILAHKYASIDVEKAYRVMKDNLEDIKLYLKILSDKLSELNINIESL